MPPPSGSNDPIPLTPAQVLALFGSAARELRVGLRAVSFEISHWRSRAHRIPQPEIRERALESLNSKRGHIDGAALFWILSPRPSLALLRVLVAYDILCDYLDSLTEHPEGNPGSARQLHVAMTDALRPGLRRGPYLPSMSDRDDGGYLQGLVASCQSSCAALPAFAAAQPYALREAERAATVLPANHLPAPERDLALRAWAEHEFPGHDTLAWFELSAAASTWLAVQAALALAADPHCTAAQVAETCAAYFPWCSLAGTMLDSYVDEDDDLRTGNHRYVAHYPDRETMVDRVGSSITQSARSLRALPQGPRHTLILACMVAMYLSKDSARAADRRASTRRLAASGGSLTRLLVPILRAWRIRYGQQNA